MKLIVGLGNPGTQYQQTRHNAGFMVVERLARRHQLLNNPPRQQFRSAVLDGRIANQRCLLMQPLTFMNRSGQSVGEAVTFFKLDPATDLLIIVDDIALPCGKLRLRARGSAGGHNGMADIERALGTREYPRLRVGIDPPGRIPQVDYVLGRFTPDQQPKVDLSLDTACDIVEFWLEKGLEPAMTRYNNSGDSE